MRLELVVWSALSASSIAAMTGCGPAPYTVGPEELSAAESLAVGESEATRTVGSEDDGWRPRPAAPRPNPFEGHRVWTGGYVCEQGRTSLVLRVLDARGPRMRAVFEFQHEPTAAAGRFLLDGRFDERTGRILFRPGAWIEQPEGYVAVGMVGAIGAAGQFEGRILGPGCQGFELLPRGR